MEKKNNKYYVYDIRLALAEQLVIIMATSLFAIKEGGLWFFDTALWIFISIVNLISIIKIWRGDKE